jgi:hypothetical protein
VTKIAHAVAVDAVASAHAAAARDVPEPDRGHAGGSAAGDERRRTAQRSILMQDA